MWDAAKNFVIPFLIGGFTVGAVKYVTTRFNNPGLAAIFGGIPVGLLSIYFVANEQTYPYAVNYFYVTMILGISIVAFYTLHSYTSLSKNQVLLMAVLLWVLLVGGRYMLTHDETTKEHLHLEKVLTLPPHG
jgi:uncharacterized membrane protein